MDGYFRSLAYMRPLAIWAMQWALNPPESIANAPRVPSVDRTTSETTHNAGFVTLADALRNPLPQLRKLRRFCDCLCRKKEKALDTT